MSSQRNYEFPNIEWQRKMFALIWCLIASFCTSVLLVTASFYIFDPSYGDGRDPFIQEIKTQQKLNKLFVK